MSPSILVLLRLHGPVEGIGVAIHLLVQKLAVQQDRPKLLRAQGAPALRGNTGGTGIEAGGADAAAFHALLPLDHIGAAHLAAAAHADRPFSYLL